MTALLRIETSPRTDARSLSRRLTTRFVSRWREANVGADVVRRDLRGAPPSFVDDDWIAAAFEPRDALSDHSRKVLAASDTLVDEFLAADEYLIGTPIYNFGPPAALKAYIDQIVRINRTFAMNPGAENPYTPLVPAGRRMTVLVASGDAGYEPGGPLASFNFLEPHLRAVFGLMGVTDLRFIYAGYDELGGEPLEHSTRQAMTRVDVATA